MIAEDDQVNRIVIEALLRRLGLLTAVAINGREAIKMAREHAFAAILIAAQMPEINGFEATRRIRSAEGIRHVPIIAIVSPGMPRARERCLAAGMDAYLSKPLRGDELSAVLSDCLSADLSHPCALPAPGTEADVSDEGEPVELVLDPEVTFELRKALTAEMSQQLVESFQEQLSTCVAAIQDAVGRGDREALRSAAHQLKGSAAALGANKLRRISQRLEHAGRGTDEEVGRAQIDEIRKAGDEALTALSTLLV